MSGTRVPKSETRGSPVIGEEESDSGEDEGEVDAIVLVDGGRQVAEAVGETEIVGAPRLLQLDVAPAQVLVHGSSTPHVLCRWPDRWLRRGPLRRPHSSSDLRPRSIVHVKYPTKIVPVLSYLPKY